MNAISSLAFVVFGIVIWLSANRSRGRERANRWVFGGLMVATGIGSVLFHGPQGPASHFLHDATFLVALVALVVLNLAGVLGWRSRQQWTIFGLVSGSLMALLLVWPTSTNILAGVVVLVLVSVDILIHRSSSVRQRWWTASVVAMGSAILLFVLGRTGGPLCESDSLFQGHALWHILSAFALWAYFEATAIARRETSR